MTVSVIARPQSIAGRLLLFSGIFVTLSLVIASLALWLVLKDVVRQQIDQRLDTQIGALGSAITRDATGAISLSPALDGPPFDRPASGWYWQVEADGQYITSRSLMNATLDTPPQRQDLRHLLSGVPAPGKAEDENGGALYVRQVTRSIDGLNVTIAATAPMAALADPALRALLWLVPAMLLLGAVLLMGTIWQIRFGLRPLKTMAADIDAINRGEQLRLPSQPSVELAPLSSNTNALLEINEQRLSATRMQFANLAHGLKSPVASLLLGLDDNNDPDGALRNLASRIDQRIKHHLSAARHVMAAAGNAGSTDLASSVADLHGAISRIHAERQIAFEAVIADNLRVACDASDVEEMLGNLIDNAFKWAASRVVVDASRDGPGILIVVSDDGAGIAADRLDAVMLPGVREDERVAGSGFGLAIVKELAELYGGSLTLEHNLPTGLRAVLRLPAHLQPGDVRVSKA